MNVVSFSYIVTVKTMDNKVITSDALDCVMDVINFVENYKGEVHIDTEVMIEDDDGNWKTIPCPQEDDFYYHMD